VLASNSKLKGIRIDSGDLGIAAKEARVLLDKLGASQAQIMVSGDLDEYKIKDLMHAPIDAFESGHKLVTGSGAASAGFVYKLVAVEDDHSDTAMRTVQKKSKGKVSRGGKKIAMRKIGFDGTAIEESIFTNGISEKSLPSNGYRNLQSQIMRLGQSVDIANLEDSRNHLMKIRAEIPETIQLRVGAQPAIPSVNYPKGNTDG
jgi:nicotinate phosphoribosyltransferase